MADYDPLDLQNETLEAMFAERLRDLPSKEFRKKLKEKLMHAATNQASYIPEGSHTVNPYLICAGAARLLEFMTEAFDARELGRFPTPQGTIMHAEVRIDDSQVELSDGSEEHPPSPTSLHLYVPDADATYERAMAAGATSLGAPADREYGDREAAITDPSGNHWYVATHRLVPGGYRPEGLYAVTLFLHPKGAPELIRFMEEGLGAQLASSHPNPDGTIAHAVVRIGDSVIEMGEAHGPWQPMPASIHLYVPDADAVYARALEAGGTSIMPVSDRPYGERTGGVRDAWGNRWWIATYTGKTKA